MTGPTFAATAVVPRPVPPAPPPARPAPRHAAEPPAPPILAWLKLHAMAVLFCGALLGGALAAAAYTLVPVEHESYALLRVASSPFSVANQKDPNRSKTDFTTYLKTNARLIKSEFVLIAALKKPQSGNTLDLTGPRIADLATLKAQPNPIKFLTEKLNVSWADGDEVITISFAGGNPQEVQAVVNAVQQAYMDEVIETEIKDRRKYLETVESTLVSLTDSYKRKAGVPAGAQLPDGVGFGAVQPAGGVPPAPGQLPPLQPVPLVANGPPEQVKKAMTDLLIRQVANLKGQVEQLPLAIAMQKAKVAQLEKMIKTLAAGPPTQQTIDEIENDPEYRELKAKAAYYRGKYNHDKAAYENPDAPSVMASKAEAERADRLATATRERKLIEREAAKKQAKNDSLLAQFDDAVRVQQAYEEQLRADAARLVEKEAELAKLPPDPAKDESIKQAAAKGPSFSPQLTDLLAQDDVFRGMTVFATQLRLDQESPKRVTILQAASTPLPKDGKKQILFSLAAGVMGFVLCGLVAAGAEFKAKKVCTLTDVAGHQPLPVVGVIPWVPNGTGNRDDIAEGIDKLRAYVAQAWLARGATTVAVTSTMSDEGKPYTAFALATRLAAAGYRTLLADFDLKSPAMHRAAGVPNDAGVCELLRGEVDFRQAIIQTPTGLHLLPAGTWTDDARVAAVGGRLEALLQRLKEPFDCVVIHTHAILTAAETVEVARRCDAVLVCTLCRESRVPLVKRAAERVAVLEIPFAGVVYLGATRHEALC